MAHAKKYGDFICPFNSFRWDSSEEGYLFWYERALGWCVFFYSNYDNIDKDELEKIGITKMLLVKAIHSILLYYINPDMESDIKDLECVKEAEKILKENNVDFGDIFD